MERMGLLFQNNNNNDGGGNLAKFFKLSVLLEGV
jgi:hypothetical protein